MNNTELIRWIERLNEADMAVGKASMRRRVVKRGFDEALIGEFPLLHARLFELPESRYTTVDGDVRTIIDEIRKAQRKKIDLVRIYKNKAEMFPGNMFASLFGFPRKPWEELEKIITSKTTKKTWETGEMEVIDPLGAVKK